MQLFYKNYLLLGFLGIVLTICLVYNFSQASVKEIKPEQIGLKLNYTYKNENNSPVVTVNWTWDKSSFNIIDAQDLIGLIWEYPEQWIISLDKDSLEGGGGPGLRAIEQMQLQQKGKGLSYTGKPLNIDGHVIFKRLPNPPNTKPQLPKQIMVLFIHPQRNLLSHTDVYVIKETLTN